MSASSIAFSRALPAAPRRTVAPRPSCSAGPRRRIEPAPRASALATRRTASPNQPSDRKEGVLTSLGHAICRSVAAAFWTLLLVATLALLSLIPDGFDGTALVVAIIASGHILAGFVALEGLRLLRALATSWRRVETHPAVAPS